MDAFIFMVLVIVGTAAVGAWLCDRLPSTPTPDDFESGDEL